MSIRPTHAQVVVGVDGSEANLGAVRYAIAEARSTGAGLTLVHVVPDHLPVSPLMPVTPGDLTDTGTKILRESEARVHEVAPDLAVECWLHHGTRAVELSRAAAEARLLVVGRDDRTLVERLLRGDTATGVAARATTPVVEVPSDWEPAPEGPHGTVVAGVKEPAHAQVLLGDAFGVARAHGATLVVLHAWKLPSGYDDVIEDRVALDDFARSSTEEIESLLRESRTTHPEVKVEVRVVHDHAGHALVAASRDADLVVLLRRGRGIPAATHLGGTARAVLRSAECPVRVVAPDEER